MADGFFMGELYGKTGLVPSNFVQLVLEHGDSSFDNSKSGREAFRIIIQIKLIST